MSLTQDAVNTIIGFEHASDRPNFQPIMQVIQLKLVGSRAGNDRYRIILSDGTLFAQGMLATQLNDLVTDNKLSVNCLVHLKNFSIQTVQGCAVVIVLQLDILDEHPGERIGSPLDFRKVGNNARSATTAPAVSPHAAAPPLYGNNNNNNNNNAGTIASNTSSDSNPYNYRNDNATPSQTTSNNLARINNNNMNSPQRSNPYGGGSSNNNNGNNGSPANPYTVQSHGPGVGSAPIVQHRSVQGQPITSISQLNMYQNRWTIKARVVNKSDIRTWSNAKGEGSLFSVDLLDSTMDIRATFFRDAVDRFYNVLVVGQVYSFSGGRLKVANMQYNTCKSNFEITFDTNSEIRLQDDTGEIQAESYNLVKIADIEHIDAGKTVDVLAIVKEVGEVQSIISKKKGTEIQKCDLTLVDDSGVQIRLTLWGSTAVSAKQQFNRPNLVAGFRAARISDYGGKSLSGNGVSVEPNVPETQLLQQWWHSQGQNQTYAAKSLSNSGGSGGSMDSFSDRKTVSAIKDLNLGYSEKGDYLSFTGQLSFIKKDKDGGAWYPACPNPDDPCRNRCKVTQTPDGNWTCSRCQGTFPNCNRKWIFSATVADDTGSTWVSVFDDQALILFDGVTADEAFQGYDNPDQYDSYFAKASFTEWIFKCRVRNEIVNDEQRVKTQVVRMDPVDYVADSKSMLAVLDTY